MLTDTHSHFPNDPAKIKSILRRAADAGVAKIVAVGGSDELNSSARLAFEIAKSLPCPRVLLAQGFDRDQASRNDLPPTFSHDELFAIGEIGLDYAVCDAPREKQRALFEAQLAQAANTKLPVIIHTRNAEADTLAILANIAADFPKSTPEEGLFATPGVIHCFTGDADFGEKLLELGFWISFSGIITFRNADALRDTARTLLKLAPEKILTETDSPYLAPVPLRGTENESANVALVAKLLESLR